MCHALGVRVPTQNWIVDSGATYHICNFKELFEDLHPLSRPQKVTLSDGHTLEAIGTGAVEVKLKLTGEESKIGRLKEVLYMPTLAYNLLSVAKVTEAGKVITFGETQGKVINGQGEVVAVASGVCITSIVSHCITNRSTQRVINPRRICGTEDMVIWER